MTAQPLRLVVPEAARTTRRRVVDEQVINLTVAPDPRLLLTVAEAARRLGIGRSLMYQLIGEGQIESITIGRLRKVSLSALDSFVDHRSTVPEGKVRG